MSSDDSEDDARLKQFLEAADTNLLNNSMFQKISDTEKDLQTNEEAGKTIKSADKKLNAKDLPKSQRYLPEDDDNICTDFNLPQAIQNHLAKKFSEIIQQKYEFIDDAAAMQQIKNEKNKKHKSRLKLLKGDDFYVNTYEDFEYETKGPLKKPSIKRRTVKDNDEEQADSEHDLKLVTIDGNDILSGSDTKHWCPRKERKDKVFHYKSNSKGAVAHAIEGINEFTHLRRKNKWNENKIKDFNKRIKK